MTNSVREQCIKVLEHELIPALGCTEPIAIALASAKARKVLGVNPEHIDVYCSGNIVKNVKGVTVPNSKGLKGIGVAAVLGLVGGDADNDLEVLGSVTDEDIAKTVELLKTDFFTCKLVEGVDNLYISAVVTGEGHTATVTIANNHTNVVHVEKDGEVLKHIDANSKDPNAVDKSFLSMEVIWDFITNVDIADIDEVLTRQIELNTTISNEGLKNDYGARIGKVLLAGGDNSVRNRAKAAAAAGSDARMNGCALPVVINSGSGNQGITLTMPTVIYAKELGSSKEDLYRALALANLISLHCKRHIGSLSAYCGAATAATGAGAAITYLYTKDYDAVCRTVINALATISGMVCDGAKASCASKIAIAVENALLAHEMSMKGIVFPFDEGILQLGGIEKTIESVGHMAREGMKDTDITILKIMTGDIKF